MKVLTKYHGELNVEDSEITHFPQGIPSFLDEKKFYILPFLEESPFMIMQSIQTPGLAFVIVSPFDFFKDYSVKLADSIIETLEIKKQEDVAVFVILTIQEPFSNTTANLQGPIIINNARKLGKQVILSESTYRTKNLLTSQLSSKGKGG